MISLHNESIGKSVKVEWRIMGRVEFTLRSVPCQPETRRWTLVPFLSAQSYDTQPSYAL